MKQEMEAMVSLISVIKQNKTNYLYLDVQKMATHTHIFTHLKVSKVIFFPLKVFN